MMYWIKKQILRVLQERINRKNRKKLLHRDRAITIIANNCLAGYIYHYLNLRFESPTINLFIPPADYIRMLSDFDKYFDPDAEIIEVRSEKKYPVGEIYGCRIHFMHYKDFETAVRKWRERCARIDKESLYVMMTDRDGCQMEDLIAFDKLDYKNKVAFTCRKYEDIHSAFCIRGFEKQNSVGQLQETMSITGRRYIDQFDYIEFLNRV